MSQKTNLNINPYYDDFDSEKNFYKVLFKPGFPVQSRELTTLQSILQNQVENFGSHIFKEGSVVIPGSITYDNEFYALKVNTTQFGVDISVYIENFIGKTIIGQSSGITAKVQKIVFPDESDEVEYITLYVKYLESDSNFEFTQFLNGELLYCNEIVIYGNTTIQPGSIIASAISSTATSVGSAAFIDNGVYFIRGYFVSVSSQNIILDYYSNFPSYRVGLKISESIVGSKDDDSLFDNAKGFTNYSSPGADRLKISLTLTKKSLDDVNDVDFVELLRLEDGKINKINNKTSYNQIKDYIAERTYDESGDYTVIPFGLNIQNSLNDRLGNNGVFFENELTDSGNIPSNDIACLKITPGKAYVRGYDIEKNGSTILDFDKPRNTKNISNITVPFQMGNVLRVNNVSGIPKIRSSIDLYSQFGSSQIKIGEARVYSFNLTDAEYSSDSTSWDLRLYDIQTYTRLSLNQSVSSSEIKESFFVKGKSSGASGFATADGSSSVIYLRQTSGSFIRGESLIVNGIDISRSIVEYQVYNTQSIKSLKQLDPFGYGNDFTADLILEKFRFSNSISIVSITEGSGGVSTITSSNTPFVGITTDTIVRYQKTGSTEETYNRVSSISSDSLSLEVKAIPSVAGVFNGTLPTSELQVNAFLGFPEIRGSGTLYARLPEPNASSVDLSSSNIYITEQLVDKDVNINDQIVLSTSSDFSGISSVSWTTFDQERYTVAYSNGEIQTLDEDLFELSGNILTLKGLNNAASNNDTVINVTAIKNGIKSKIKTFTKSTVLNISGSKLQESGTTSNNTKNDGLTYNQYYGLRVQDEEISLNYPDVVKVLSVYESLNSSAPVLDRIEFTSSANVTVNAIIGENIIGSSGAIARVVTKPAANILGVIYLNDIRVSVNESVTFEDSGIVTNIESIIKGSYKDITSSFKLNRGQKEQYYDYSRLVRNKSIQEPSRKILVVFDHYTVPSTDDGDVFTVLSYDSDRFEKDIPNIGGKIRASDTLDFRPRVAFFDPSVTTDRSPFDFNARTAQFNTTPLRILASDEGSVISETFYTSRIDKVYLDTLGNFIIDKGIPSKNPKAPVKNSELLELATINLPAYLYNVSDASIVLKDNRRYTMRDIGAIEDRVETLEEVTSLSLLELSTQTLQVKDAEGLDRFKSGYFVDDFIDDSRVNTFLSSTIVDTVSRNLIADISRNTLESLVASSEDTPPETLDLTDNFVLLDPSIRKTGKVLTLAYTEIDWLEQPFATKVENVNPFNIVVYTGDVQLSPITDNWTRTVQLPDRSIDRGVTQRQTVNLNNTLVTERTVNSGRGSILVSVNRTTETVSRSTSTSSFDTVDTTIRNDVVGSFDDRFIRSRNVEFKASGLKPNTRFYQFFDGNSGVDVIPKLIEISKNRTLEIPGASAAFQVGETVVGIFEGQELIRFRICTPNHKTGNFRNPETVYNQNPYIKTETLGSLYSSSSKTINVDTSSLSAAAQGRYFGYIQTGMQLVGQTSGAIAFVKSPRLISDNYGDLIGTFFLRDPYSRPTPSVRIPTGTRTYKLTSSRNNSPSVPGTNSISYAENNYTANATVLQFQRTLTSETTRTTVNSTSNLIRNTTTITRRNPPPPPPRRDPLAQTFTVGGNISVKSNIDTQQDANGVFLTSVDLYFASIDSGNAEVTIEIRTVELGIPTLEVIGTPVTIRPRTVDQNGNEVVNINTSTTGEIATNIKFPEPIFLPPGREYAIVIISDKSDSYELWTAVMGEKTVNTQNLPDVDSVIYTQQFALGSLFKSQNGSIWTTNQFQDLKFKLYKAQFISNNGTAYFYNPPLDESNGYIPTLVSDPITILPKTGRIGVTTITNAGTISLLSPGRKLSGVNGNSGSALISGQGGSVLTSSTLTAAGKNYPASVTNEVVDTFNITGKGTNLKLLITTNSNGVITGAARSTTNSGNGYQVGDIVGIVTSSTSTTTGKDARITISAITGVDTLYLTNVQGEFSDTPGAGKEFNVGIGVSVFDNSGNVVSLAGTNITQSVSDGGINSGEYMRVDHFNHGMNAPTNKLILDKISSNIPTTSITSDLSVLETNTISIADTSNFVTFEGTTVSGAYPGYVKIGTEIIEYNGVSNGSLSISANGRGYDNTIAISHLPGSTIQKYEIGGVSLRRINGITNTISEPIEMDSYYVKFDRGISNNNKNRSSDSATAGLPELSFNDLSLLGGSNVTATQNILYGSVIPTYDIITPGSLTSVNARMRTVTATSIDGNEESFNDNGYETIQLNTLNEFNSLRMVCSEVNQDQYTTSLPRNKSLTTAITFITSDNNLSPVLDLDTAFTEFYSNRINNPISNYSFDNRVNSILNDPHASVYYTNTVTLQNPASTLKVILSAERPSSTDFRVLYSLIRADSSEIDQSFELFPGYPNLNQTTDGFLVIDESKNTGLPDRKVRESLTGEFLEYEFTANNLDLFIGFTIKIVMSGTNQAVSPRISDLRTIAVR